MSNLQEIRDKAEKKFSSLPMPASKDENYRFLGIDTDFSSIQFSSQKSFLVSTLATEPCEEEAALLLIDGEASKLKKGKTFPSSGLLFTDFISAGEKHASILEKNIPSSVFDFSQDKVAQLAIARFQNGAFVHVEDNTKIASPIRVLQWKNTGAQIIRNLIVLEAGAELKMIEEFAGVEEEVDSLAVSVTEIHVKEGAKISYFPVQVYGKNTNFFHRLSVCTEKNAQVEIYPISVGGKKGQYRLDLHAAARGANFLTKGAARGNFEQQFDFWVNMNHSTPEATSALDYWFVMDEKSKAIFNGMIRITKAANHTTAYQKCRSLLLSSKATVHAIPKLEIATDEVKCNHGASISSVNPEQVHYLQARGITKNDAEKMIIRGFTEPVLEKLPTKMLYERIDQYFSQDKNEAIH